MEIVNLSLRGFLNPSLRRRGANRATIQVVVFFSRRWGLRLILVLKVSGKRYVGFMNTPEAGHPALMSRGLCLPFKLPN